MKTWTYLEAKNKVQLDLNLTDEDFITGDELSGYFNDVLQDVSAIIYDTNQDGYLLSKYYVPGVQGQAKFPLPDNIFATKIRHIRYMNGSMIYDVRQYRRKSKFIDIALTDQYGQPDDYRYLLVNDGPGQSYLEFHPVLRESTILPPQSGAFTPLIMEYYRGPSRIPIIGTTGVGEFCNSEIIAPNQVNTGTSVITVKSGTTTYGIKSQGQVGCYPGSIPYVTGDQIQFQPAYGDTMIGGLTAGVTYFVIALSSTTIQVATTLANAKLGTYITLTSAPTIFTEIKVAATQNIVNATLIDIPEFAPYVIQYVKCKCLPKEGDPRLEDERALLQKLEIDMIASLTNAIPDDDDTVQGDFSHYYEMT